MSFLSVISGMQTRLLPMNSTGPSISVLEGLFSKKFPKISTNFIRYNHDSFLTLLAVVCDLEVALLL